MKLNSGLLTLALIASVSCGTDDKGQDEKKPAQEKPVKVTEKAELEKLKAIEAGMPKNVLTRVPVKNGQPQYDQVEAITVAQSVDATDPKAMEQAFANATADQRISNISSAENFEEGSTEQLPWPREGWYLSPWRRRMANMGYDLAYGAGYNGYYQPYQNVGNCCYQYQPVCGQQVSYYQYTSFQQFTSGGWYGGGFADPYIRY